MQKLLSDTLACCFSGETHLFVVVPKSREWGKYGLYVRSERGRDVEERHEAEAPVYFGAQSFDPPDVRELSVVNLFHLVSSEFLRRIRIHEIPVTELNDSPRPFFLYPLQSWALVRTIKMRGRFFVATR